MTDVLTTLSNAVVDTGLAALLEQRLTVSRHAQSSFTALLEPPNDSDLPLRERMAIVLRVARMHSSEGLASLYRDRLATLEGSDHEIHAIEYGLPLPSDDARLTAILAHAELVSLHPADAGRGHLRQLAQAGLSTAAVVTLTQLIGFVAFQARALAGIELLKGRP
jgi:CMD domain protein